MDRVTATSSTLIIWKSGQVGTYDSYHHIHSVVNPGKHPAIFKFWKCFNDIPTATGQVITKITEGTSADVDLAVSAAANAMETVWGLNTPGAKRGELLYKLAELVEKNKEELAALEALDNGKHNWIRRIEDFYGCLQAKHSRRLCNLICILSSIRWDTMPDGLTRFKARPSRCVCVFVWVRSLDFTRLY